MNRTAHYLKLFFGYVIVFAITYWYLSYYRNMLYSLSADEGIFLYGAKRVLDGQVIYRDFFSHFFPGNYYLLALIYKLFGYSFSVAREAVVIIDCLINVLVFYLSYKALKAWYAILPPLFFLVLGFPNWMQFSHYWTSELFLLVSLIFFLWYLETDKYYYLYLSGFLIGITTLFLQMPGVYAGILFLLVLLSLKFHEKVLWKLVINFTISAVIPLIIIFGYIAYKGAFGNFIQEEALIIFNLYPKTLAFDPFLFIFKGEYPYNLIIGTYCFLSVMGFLSLFIFIKHLKNITKVVLMGNSILFLSILHSMDLEHVLPYLPLFLIMVFIPVRWLLEYTKQKYIFVKYAMETICGLLLLWSFVSIKSNIHRIDTQAYHVNINGTHVWTFNEKQAYEINEFFPQIKKILNGDKNVFVYPYGPLIYVLLNLNNPVFTDMMPQIIDIPDYGRYSYYRAVQDLRRSKMQYIIYCNWPQNYINTVLALNNKTYQENILDKFINDNYLSILHINNLILLKKI